MYDTMREKRKARLRRLQQAETEAKFNRWYFEYYLKCSGCARPYEPVIPYRGFAPSCPLCRDIDCSTEETRSARKKERDRLDQAIEENRMDLWKFFNDLKCVKCSVDYMSVTPYKGFAPVCRVCRGTRSC